MGVKGTSIDTGQLRKWVHPWPGSKAEAVSDKWERGRTNDSAALAGPFFSGSVQLCKHGR